MQLRKEISIYQTPKDMEEMRHRRVASIDPAERIQETVDLILRVYGLSRLDLEDRKRATQINFTKLG